jgi:hypothetical protein
MSWRHRDVKTGDAGVTGVGESLGSVGCQVLLHREMSELDDWRAIHIDDGEQTGADR